MKLINTLVSCIFTVQDMKVNVRCMSHIASTPKEVEEWVPVNLKELGDTVMMDRRTVELMDGADVEFLIHPQTKQFLGVMVYNQPTETTKNGE